MQASLKTNSSCLAKPAILLSNVSFLDNNLDFLRQQLTTQYELGDYCVFVYTESWFKDSIPDASIQLAGITTHHENRIAALSDKTHSGGLCVFINNEWCRNAIVVFSYCLLLVDFITVKCWPYYLPRVHYYAHSHGMHSTLH